MHFSRNSAGINLSVRGGWVERKLGSFERLTFLGHEQCEGFCKGKQLHPFFVVAVQFWPRPRWGGGAFHNTRTRIERGS